MTTSRPPTIDPVAATRWRDRLPLPSAWLHEEVARRMQQRLDIVTLQPQAWGHWEPLRGGLAAQQALSARYPNSKAWMLFSGTEHPRVATEKIAVPWWDVRQHLPRRLGGGGRRPEVALLGSSQEPVGQLQMLWANMALHMAADPEDTIRQWAGLLQTGGFLMFSCLGPDTLRELRAVYGRAGWPTPMHDYTDMHDWGDMLIAHGFAEPVMDMERVTLTFETPQRLLQELRGLGRNLHAGRFPALRGRAWYRGLLQALEALAVPGEGGRLALSFEIVYGHAIKAARKMPVQGELSLSLDDMRGALRRGRNGA